MAGQKKSGKCGSVPKGYRPAYFRPHYAKEWGCFGADMRGGAEALRAMGRPHVIERREGEVIILYRKESK